MRYVLGEEGRDWEIGHGAEPLGVAGVVSVVKGRVVRDRPVSDTRMGGILRSFSRSGRLGCRRGVALGRLTEFGECSIRSSRRVVRGLRNRVNLESGLTMHVISLTPGSLTSLELVLTGRPNGIRGRSVRGVVRLLRRCSVRR